MCLMSTTPRPRRRSSLARQLTSYSTVLDAPPETLSVEELPEEVPERLAEAAGTPEGEQLPAGVRRWSGVIGVEGEKTGDGRKIEVGALRWPDDLAENPIPLRYVSSDVGAHDGAQVVGVIDEIKRMEPGEDGSVEIWGAGLFDDDVNAAVAAEAYRHVEKKLTNGVSMDLDDVVFEVQPDPNNPALENMTTQDARIRAATIVAIPAFARAKIAIEGGFTSDVAAETATTESTVQSLAKELTENGDGGPFAEGFVKAADQQAKSPSDERRLRLRRQNAHAIVRVTARRAASYAYQTTRVKDADGNWVETPAAAIDIAQNTEAPEDAFTKGLELLQEGDQLELGSPEYVAKAQEALPLFQKAAEEGGDRAGDAKKVIEVLEAYLAIDWTPAEEQNAEQAAEDAKVETPADPAATTADQKPAAAPAEPAQPAQAAAAGDTHAFAFNADQWRNPRNGQWIDMPGRIIARLESQIDTDSEPGELIEDAREVAHRFVNSLNEGDLGAAMDDLEELTSTLEGMEGDHLSDEDGDAIRAAIDKIEQLKTVDWYSVPMDSDGVGEWDEVAVDGSSAGMVDVPADTVEPDLEGPTSDVDLDVDYGDVIGLKRDLRDAISPDDLPDTVLEYLNDLGARSPLTGNPISNAWMEMEAALSVNDVERARRARDEIFDALDSMMPADDIITRESLEEDEAAKEFLHTVEDGLASVVDDVRETLGKLGARTEPLASRVALAKRGRFAFATYNWVDDVGGLPGYIRDIADSLMKKGHSESRAIATAVKTVKRWAKGGPARQGGEGHVSAKTQAKAAAALAEWEAKKARANADSAASITASMYERVRESLTASAAGAVAAKTEMSGVNQTIAQMKKQFRGYGSRRGATYAPVEPPKAWFENPNFKQATPLHITDEGQVYGHLASWNACHLGSPAGEAVCVMAPRSRSGYAYFHTGAVKTAEGELIATGHLTMDGNHAGPGLTAGATMAHYDNTTKTWADVRVGEDAYGIWVAGALRPQVTPAEVRTLRASPLSGDWRRVGRSLELMIGLSVNGPGFAIPRPQGLVASAFGDSEASDHELMSLVAAGMLAPAKVLAPGTEGAFSIEELRYLKTLAAKDKVFQAEQKVKAFAAARAREKVAAFASRMGHTEGGI